VYTKSGFIDMSDDDELINVPFTAADLRALDTALTHGHIEFPTAVEIRAKVRKALEKLTREAPPKPRYVTLPSPFTARQKGWKYQVNWIENDRPCMVRLPTKSLATEWKAHLEEKGFTVEVVKLLWSNP
jgi:hypothetical protein